MRRSTRSKSGLVCGVRSQTVPDSRIWRHSRRSPRSARRLRPWVKDWPTRWMLADSDLMTTSGQATYFDGVTSSRHDVTVTLGTAALLILAADGHVLAEWPYAELEAIPSRHGLLRIGRIDNPVLARLDVRDPTFAAAIDDLSVPIDRSGRTERRDRRKVVFSSLAATVSLLLVAIYGVPEIARRLTPLVPYAAEIKLGDAVDEQVRSILDKSGAGARFVCGSGEAEQAGRAAFDKMFAKLEQAA